MVDIQHFSLNKMLQLNHTFKPFDGTNFKSWKIRMNALLEEHGVLDIVTTDIPPEKDRTEEWKKRNAVCKSKIIQHIADTRLNITAGKAFAFTIYKELEKTYERKSIVSQISVKSTSEA